MMSFGLVQFFTLMLCLSLSLALFPRDSETRQVRLLNGFWWFSADNSSNRNNGFEKAWYKTRLSDSGNVICMPVPASYNDITQDAKLRDFVGWVWYDREFFVPKQWDDEEKLRVVLRFESCHYYCIVWLNGERIMEHIGGSLPFEEDITVNLKYGASNFITVAANNTLTPTTLPPSSIEFMNDTDKYPDNYFVQNLQFDFFNYAGIHRNVKLYVTPAVYLKDLTLTTDIQDGTGVLNVKSKIAVLQDLDAGETQNDNVTINYKVYDDDGVIKGVSSGVNLYESSIEVANVNLWWPVGMNEPYGYMYTLMVTVNSTASKIVDIYRQPFGFRTVDVDKKRFYINKKPFYFKGFGMHEDSNIRGRGLDLSLITHDFNLLDWIGANSFRTSHYPYCDEIMDLADQQGIVVIDECPGVGIQSENLESKNLDHHKDVMKELIHRDKNHPAVVMWSVANEPSSHFEKAETYFKELVSYTKKLDSSARPVTYVGHEGYWNDKAVKYVDVVCWNHYYAWYGDYGQLSLISKQLERDLTAWNKETDKPFILAEYGADAVAGIHTNPPIMFSEEYQAETLKQYFPVFDKLKKDFLIGEMVWNFADFATAQDVKRPGGNKKGVFTRERQPKFAAHVLRERYKSLSSLNDNKTTITSRGVLRDDIEDVPGILVNFIN